MDSKTVRKRMEAAHAILSSGTVDLSSLGHIKTLLSGFHPRLDAAVDTVHKSGTKLLHLEKGQVIDLAVDALPEASPEDKKRKKALLLFLGQWNSLKSEVARVEKELGDDFGSKSVGDKAGAMGAILGAMKGPLGIVTLIAVGIVALKMTEVTVRITNQGCQPIAPSGVSINIPGLKLPNQVIGDGQTETAKVPPLGVTVDATDPAVIRLSVLGMNQSFPWNIGSMTVLFDDTVLNGSVTQLNLGSQKEHELVLLCKVVY